MLFSFWFPSADFFPPIMLSNKCRSIYFLQIILFVLPNDRNYSEAKTGKYTVALRDCLVASANYKWKVVSPSVVHCSSLCRLDTKCSSYTFNGRKSECIGMDECTRTCPASLLNWNHFCEEDTVSEKTCTTSLHSGCIQKSGFIKDPLHSCPSAYFNCPGTSRCVAKILVCDGANECDNGEDEVNCDSHNCTKAMIDLGLTSWVCDKTVDCLDGGDELYCNKKPTTHAICNMNCNLCTDGSLQCEPKPDE